MVSLIESIFKTQKLPHAIPSLIPYLSKRSQLLLPKGLLPLVAKIPADIYIVKKALARQRIIGIIQPLEEKKTKKQLCQVGCVGRITTFSENDDGSLYIVLKGIKRFVALAEKGNFLQVDYTPYNHDNISFQETTLKKRYYLAEILKGYFSRLNIEINWQDIINADDESLITSLAMMCPFDASEKQAILESVSLEERFDMIIAFIEMNEIQQSPHRWKTH